MNKFGAIFTAMRPHHWIKNILVLAPALWFGIENSMPLAFGFAAFCLVASAAYLVNDFFDFAYDQKCSQKSQRPLASGKISVQESLITAATLLLAGAILGWFLDILFFALVLSYAALNIAYSFYLKKIYLLDVIVVAVFYYLRVLCGFILLAEQPTAFQYGFFALILLSLSFLKRTAEVKETNSAEMMMAGRGYNRNDLKALLIFGLSSGFLGLAFYFGVEMQKFSEGWLALGCSSLLLFWLVRIWWMVYRAPLERDLVWFVLKDKTSYAVGLSLLLIHFWP